MIYFVIHGFASATPNETSKFFAENVIGPRDRQYNLNYRFNKYAAEDLIEGVEECLEDWASNTYRSLPTIDDITFVGCSLGGYMAQHLAGIYLGHAIAINPAVIPTESLSRWLGINTNYKTDETFELTAEDVESFADFQVPSGRVPTLVLLDLADDVLDSQETIYHFEDHADIVTFEGGSHRFEHLPECIGHIKKFANTLV